MVGALAAAYVVLFLLERAVPLRRPKARLLPRLGVNLLISAAALLAVVSVVEPVSTGTLQWATSSSFGLMYLAALPGAVELVLVFLLLDLSFYYWHVANHRFALLWRIHNVHHIDPDLDVTTAFRFHFVEVVLSSGFRAAQIALIGPCFTTAICGCRSGSSAFSTSCWSRRGCTASIIRAFATRRTRTSGSSSPGGTGSTARCGSTFRRRAS